MTNKTNIIQYAIINTLNGKYRLKELSKAEKAMDDIEMELYGLDMLEIREQFNEQMKFLRAENLI